MPDGGLRIGRWAIGAGAILSLTLLAGRLSGLLREIELAAAFGVSTEADVAVLLLTLPDLLVNLVLSGGLGAALVPRLRALPPERAAALFRQVSAAVLAAFAAAALMLALWPAGVFAMLAPGLPLAGVELHRFAMAATALAIPLTAAAGTSTAYLNANDRFFVAGCGTLLFNLGVLLALWVGGAGSGALEYLAVGVAGGALVRWLSQVAAMPRAAWQPGAGAAREIDAALIRSFAAAAGAASLMLLVPVVVRAMASGIGTGAIAAFTYATKLIELPVGIMLAPLFTVALSRQSSVYAGGDTQAAQRSAVAGLQRAVLLSVAVMLPGCWFVDAVVSLVLARGQMTHAGLGRVTDLTRVALLGLPMLAVSGMAMADLNARQHSTRVLRATLGALLALPALALPGLVLGSEPLLMAAVVGFQALHAALLARTAGLGLFGADGWLTFTMLRCVVLAAVPAGLAILADKALALHNDWLRLALALLAFGAASAMSLRKLKVGSGPHAASIRE